MKRGTIDNLKTANVSHREKGRAVFWLRSLPVSLVAVAVACTLCFAQESADYRFWTTKGGRKSNVKLAVTEVGAEVVRLKREDTGNVLEFRLTQLSDEDQQFLRQLPHHDWTRFRGPGGSSVSADGDIPTKWSGTKNLAWKLPLPGRGASSPVTWRDRVYVTCYTGYGLSAETPGEMQNLSRHLLCVRRSDGELLWKATMNSQAPVQPYADSVLNHGYATHTPTVDQDGVYVHYGSSGAASYTHAGKLRWRTSCGTKVHGYGSGASPILFENVMIVSAQVESDSLIGLDTRNGRELWRAEAFRYAWCTPIIARHEGKSELVCFLEKQNAVGLNPLNGRKLWSYQTTTNDVHRIVASPIQYKNTIITTQGGYGANSFRFGGSGNVTDSHRKWNSPGIYGIPLVFQEQLIAPFRGTVRICDANTAKTIDHIRMRPSKDGFASPVIAGDKLYWVYKQDGVCVMQLGQRPKQIAHNVLDGDPSFFNASPAISNGQLFLRSDKFLYCIAKQD